jgi:hypothetical protein
MRIACVMILLAVSAFAQDQSAMAVAACGPKDASFEVKLDKSQHTVAQPEPGKALIYFIQDLGKISCIGSCGTTKVGLNGKWVGAIKHNSYFSISVDPGEQHLCANPGPALAFAHVNAEAGKVYYFRTRFFSSEAQQIFNFDPIDSDQGRYLISLYPLSVARPNP